MDNLNNIPKIVLASASPRRKRLLEELGLSFTVDPSGIDEKSIQHKSHREFAIRAAWAKAADVAGRHDNALVIGSDTIVCLDDDILGKPSSPDEARDMLRRLRGRAHEVITGVAVLRAGTPTAMLDAAMTKVYFKRYHDKTLEDYVATNHPMDKAGAYGIQGGGGRLVNRIRGDYFNVVGLPLGLLLKMLSQFINVRPYEARLEKIEPPF